MKTLKQWELPFNSQVVLPDDTEAVFLYMDGMYAKWMQDGKKVTGNFAEFELREDGKYYVV